MAICAFCREDRRLTKEHVIPAFVLRFLSRLGDGKASGWVEVAQKSLSSDSVVRDVCAPCNNEVLGELDSYGKSCLEKAGLLTPNYSSTSLDLFYNHDLLLRWLLKISFNAARTTGSAAMMLEEFIPFILGRTGAPSRTSLFVLASLAAPMSPEDRRLIVPEFEDLIDRHVKFNPFLFRISNGYLGQECAIRSIFMGALSFHLVLPTGATTPGGARILSRSIAKQLGAVELLPASKFVQVNAGPRSWVDLWTAQLLRQANIERRS